MDSSEDSAGEEPTRIDPYETLQVPRDATASDIKHAYRKLALKNHPDKATEGDKKQATEAFQRIAFAYAVLSDPARRSRYDATGSTAESIVDAEGFNWSEFYREQFRDVISDDAIEKFAKKYKGSQEEMDDILAAYEEFEGDMDEIFANVMLSDVMKDEKRFREIINNAITEDVVPAYDSYIHESKRKKANRVKAAKAEAREAEEYARELGVHDKLFGGKKKAAGKKSKADDESELAALISRNQKKRASLLDDLAYKYAAADGKKRPLPEDEPSEEAFQAAAKKLKKPKTSAVEKGKGSEKTRK